MNTPTISNDPCHASHQVLPASNVLTGLGAQFDLSMNSDYLRRYDAIQSAGQSQNWSYRTSNGGLISMYHDTPMIGQMNIVDSAKHLFPEGANGFREQIVVDLGAGRTTDGYLVARDLGARAYVAVEFCFAASLRMNFDKLASNEKTIPHAIIYDAIEEVLPALPPQSASFICSGLDETFPEFDRLLKSISSELPEKLHPQGSCLLLSSVHQRFSFPGLRNISKLPSAPVWTR